MQPIPIERGPPVPFPQMTVRSRREVDNRDAINAYAFEHWQTDGKYGINDRRDLNSQVAFYDMAPNMARTDRRNLRDAPRFVVGGGQGGGGEIGPTRTLRSMICLETRGMWHESFRARSMRQEMTEERRSLRSSSRGTFRADMSLVRRLRLRLSGGYRRRSR